MPQDLEQLDQGDHADTLQSRGLYMVDGLRDRDGGGGWRGWRSRGRCCCCRLLDVSQYLHVSPVSLPGLSVCSVAPKKQLLNKNSNLCFLVTLF